MSNPAATAIVNRALGIIGASSIADIDDAENPNAQEAKKHFEPELRATLRDAWWNCCKDRDRLTKDTAAPRFGFSYRYLMPPDCVKIRLADESAEWTREGRYVLCNLDSPLDVHVVLFPRNIALIDSDLSSAFEERLASRYASAILHDTVKSLKLLDVYAAKVRNAGMNDAQEGSARQWRGTGRYVNVRAY